MSPEPNDHNAYLPPSVEQAMTSRLQQSMPAHLKQYVGADRPAYIPPHVEREIATAMQKSMPAHLQEYSGAYIQQRIVEPTRGGVAQRSNPQLASAPPAIPNPLRLDHSLPGAPQHVANLDHMGAARQNSQFQATPGQAGQTAVPAAALANQPPLLTDPAITTAPTHEMSHTPYDFITNPAGNRANTAPAAGLLSDTKVRVVGFIIGVVLVLFLGFLIFAPKGGDPIFTAIAQEQTEIARVAALDNEQLTDQNLKNFAVNTRLIMVSNQNDYLTFLSARGTKIPPKLLLAGKNATADTALTTAQGAGTFDVTFRQLLQTKLATYQRNIRTAATGAGPNTRSQLSSLYTQASLLLEQSKQVDD